MSQKTELLASDLRVYPSLRMHDHHDGGGEMASQPLRGTPGEIFPPASDVDHIKGAFDVRLLYFAVAKAGSASLYGAHALIRDPGKTSHLSYLLFPANRYGEQRQEVMQRIEAYSVGNAESHLTLLSRQTKNSRVVQAYQRPEDPLPQVGDVYCLRQDKPGYAKAEQYIQVIKVSSLKRTFRVRGRDFVCLVVQMEISTPLNHDFVGTLSPDDEYVDNPCKILHTHVADGANYYGSQALARTTQKGDLKIKVSSIFAKLVPTSQVETPLIDLNAAGQRQPLLDSGKEDAAGFIERVIDHFNPRAHSIYHLGRSCFPGSFSIEAGLSRLIDEGGTLKMNDESVGHIDYNRGELRFIRDIDMGYNTRLRFRPAASLSRVADTAAISVGIQNRSYNYLLIIIPPPAPGTLQVSYRAQGKWYDLRDDGSGSLRGASNAYGSGQVNFISGTAQLSAGALPDVGSDILFSWGNAAGLRNRADSQPRARMSFLLQQPGVAPNSVRLSWDSDKSSQDDGAGRIQGHWSGSIDYRAGRINIDIADGFYLPDALKVRINYSHGDPKAQEFKAPLRNGRGQVELNLGEAIRPRCLKMIWNLLIEDYDHRVQEGELITRFIDPYKTVRDDGAGRLVDDGGQDFGTVDYNSGKILLRPDTTVQIPKAKYRKEPMGERLVSRDAHTEKVIPLFRYVFDGYEYIPAGAAMPIDESAWVRVEYRGVNGEESASEEHTAGPLELDLLPGIDEPLIPGSIGFSLNNEAYFDRRGELYYRLDSNTGAAIRCGTVNYETGTARIEPWWGRYNFKLESLASGRNGQPVDEVVFRVPSSPLRPQSLSVTATPLSGGQIRVSADARGQLKSAQAEGYVIEEYGIVRLRFGQKVPAAGNEQQSWYKADEIDEDGNIWRPLPVHADSITFSAVAYAYLPLDTSQIGIDAVRLPSDGLVPWLRKGDMLLLLHSESDNIGSSHRAGQMVQLSRDNIDELCVMDARGEALPADMYRYDLAAGTLTWSDALNLSEYEMPLTVKHTVLRHNRVLDLDLNGEISLQTPLDVVFPADKTMVANALIGGDLQVRATEPFSQQAWNKQWRDERSADGILAKLNVKDFPIELSSDGAITQRWAIQFISDSQFEVIGETLGLIAEGNILNDLAPINPSTQKPYFTLRRGAFGSGWAARNLIRFNTHGTQIPVWLIRAVQPSGQRQSQADQISVCLRGNTLDL